MRLLNSYILIIFLIVTCLLTPGFSSAKIEESPVFKVVIDAGHGGKDIGAADNGVKEKDINLKVAKYLESLIKKKMRNTSVVMTRDNDTYLTLQQRADKANQSQGDIFVSIHTNSVDKKNKNRKSVAGSSVYTLGLHKDENNLEVAMRENSVIELEQNYDQKYSGFDPQRDESYIIFEMAQKKNLSQSIQLADDIEKELVKSGRQDRGVHQAGFWVLWATSMPSVLVELDFICNPTSAKYISSDKGAKELAEAIFKAIQKYEKSWRRNFASNSDDNLSETYYSDFSEKMESPYSNISAGDYAVAKPRVHNSSFPKSSIKKRGERRRRSATSKELSINKNYENGDIAFTQHKSTVTSENVETLPNAEVITIVSAQTDKKATNKKKAEKKKKEKSQKADTPKKEKKSKGTQYNGKVNKLITVYKIQILASTDLLSNGNERFCGLSPVTAYKENNLYKYYYGETTDKDEMEAVLSDVRKKIPDAFIVSSQKSILTN